ncbi:MAG: hypothetical protein ACRBBO_15465 [Cognatishimia sp.]
MADAVTGEVTGRVRMRTKTLRLDMKALAMFQDATGEDAFEAIEKLDGSDHGFVTLRALVHSAMRAHHPDASLSEAQAFIHKHPKQIRGLLKGSLPNAGAPAESEGETLGNQPGAKG